MYVVCENVENADGKSIGCLMENLYESDGENMIVCVVNRWKFDEESIDEFLIEL